MGWDSRGNLTSDPASGKTYGYSSENLLTSASGGVALSYDPLMRLYSVAGASTAGFAYDGLNAIQDYDASNVVQHRYVFDPDGQPIVQYDGTGTTSRRFLSADERGSVISLTDSTGALVGTPLSYDEYGRPGAANQGRFQYTGQKWIGEAGLYDYKARDYLPNLGIFAQTDPVGYADTPNLYAYVGDDPVNLVDPTGTRFVWVPRFICATVGTDCSSQWLDKSYLAWEPDPEDASGIISNTIVGGDRGGGNGGDKPQSRQCPTDKNITATIDGGMFLGAGAGGTIGFNWNVQTNRVMFFSSARIANDHSLGFILGAGMGVSSSEPAAGTSQTSNINAGWLYGGGGVSIGNGQATINGGLSLGPKIGGEISNTTNVTGTVTIYPGRRTTCAMGGGW